MEYAIKSSKWCCEVEDILVRSILQIGQQRHNLFSRSQRWGEGHSHRGSRLCHLKRVQELKLLVPPLQLFCLPPAQYHPDSELLQNVPLCLADLCESSRLAWPGLLQVQQTPSEGWVFIPSFPFCSLLPPSPRFLSLLSLLLPLSFLLVLFFLFPLLL